ncbi:MAG: STAS domain-containing protein [Candidatus Eremiobacteraeota bacterium]|nr:STAS domain-containing protein [Candidatus Eremiobacteraeota bacterium]
MFQITNNLSDADFEQLQGTVIDAVKAGARDVVLALDTLEVLDSAVMRRLIKLLRRAREEGAADLTLAASRDDILRTLHVTALDKVFAVVPAAEVTAA